MLTAKLLLASFFTLAFGNPLAHRTMRVHESRPVVPTGFARAGATPAETMLKLRIALARSDTDGLIDTLMAVSEPASPNYGQHLSIEEVC